MINTLRIIGNVLLLSGHYTLLNYSMTLGLAIKIIGASCIIPFAIKNKLYDFFVVMGLFTAIDLHKLIELIVL